ncbi:hypothetical protein [Frankia sp. Cas3]|nr:hypothetical protein [Frankia sp. Cas3]
MSISTIRHRTLPHAWPDTTTVDLADATDTHAVPERINSVRDGFSL